jgi:hypothetical protein
MSRVVLNARPWNVFFILVGVMYTVSGFAVLRGSCIGKTGLLNPAV